MLNVLFSCLDIGGLAECFVIAICHNWSEWESMNTLEIETIVTCRDCCNEDSIRSINLFGFQKLKTLAINSECFKSVEKVWIVGLPCLEKVIVGILSFMCESEEEKKGSFTLKDCPNVKELIMGNQSFRGYTECVIENVPLLERICLGDADDEDNSCNFLCAPLSLVSRGFSFLFTLDLPRLTTLELGRGSLLHSQNAVFESMRH